MPQNLNFLNNKTILITGGTGSFGNAFLKNLLNKKNKIKKIIIFSRDELKQFEMEERYPKKKYKNLRFFLGDLRDKARVYRALEGVDIVVHAAALKQVPKAEFDPFEYINTNIIGAQNLVECCMDRNVSNVIALSTDKAVSPVNLYGATKLCSDKLFLSTNNIIGNKKIKLSVVRYGNVNGSRGSVIPVFLKQQKSGYLQITDKNMTRFSMDIEQATNMVLWSIKNNLGGEIFIPKLPSYRILDLAKAIDTKSKIKFIGVRPGEKITEELITIAESINCYDIGNYYVLLGSSNLKTKKFYSKFKKVDKNFSYNSANNKDFLNIKELKKIVNKIKLNY
ncbi:UDP-N-acetylglucosamine 4,6-dehydratase (inverting) [Candidatus Pelagibacter communis]|uniref:UDP-N-acetylglucosamine 4,6-dehydratase (inverting) n=1 Tax=Pelagibacter ubique TaxID=198252 RepID=UPI00094C6D60|nr:UDP-N-acetylglucosamine 4,6-dehydratase (inverting) [Candidatus Pelagibacter ubique]|tara:strand:+ start:775 stop:1785 length:1011 start_codon:yes stop_codon:yes gene_type:complete